jgi:hypothetical protein
MAESGRLVAVEQHIEYKRELRAGDLDFHVRVEFLNLAIYLYGGCERCSLIPSSAFEL